MAIVTETSTFTWHQKFPTDEDIDKSFTVVRDTDDNGTLRTIDGLRCESCAARLLYLNLTPDLDGDCPKCGDPLVVEE